MHSKKGKIVDKSFKEDPLLENKEDDDAKSEEEEEGLTSVKADIITSQSDAKFAEKIEALLFASQTKDKDNIDKFCREFLNNDSLMNKVFESLNNITPKTIKKAKYIFMALTVILDKVQEEMAEFHMVAETTASKLLESHMRQVALLLFYSQAWAAKTALKLLIAISKLGLYSTKELMAHFDIFNPKLGRLAKWRNGKEKEDVCTCFHLLVSAILNNGDNFIVTQLVKHRGFLNELLLGLKDDNATTILTFLSTLKTKVVENRAISKNLKMGLFNERVVKQLALLYKWVGPLVPRRIIHPSKRKRSSRDGDSKFYQHMPQAVQLQVKQMIHTFFISLFCSPNSRMSITTFDPTLGTSGTNLNGVLSQVLRNLEQPYAEPLVATFVVFALQACPDQLRVFLPSLKNPLLPRPSVPWSQAIDLLCQILKHQDPVRHLLHSGVKHTLENLVNLSLQLSLPHDLLPLETLTHFIQQGNPIILSNLLRYLEVVLEKLQQIIKATKEPNPTYSPDFLSKYASFLSGHFCSHLVDIKDLLDSWDRMVAAYAANEESLDQQMLRLLRVLILYTDVFTCPPIDVDHIFKSAHSTIKDANKLISFNLSIVELTATGACSLLLEKLESIGASPLSLLCSTIVENSESSKENKILLKSCLQKVLAKLQVVQDWEGGIWTSVFLESPPSRLAASISLIAAVIQKLYHSNIVYKPPSKKIKTKVSDFPFPELLEDSTKEMPQGQTSSMFLNAAVELLPKLKHKERKEAQNYLVDVIKKMSASPFKESIFSSLLTLDSLPDIFYSTIASCEESQPPIKKENNDPLIDQKKDGPLPDQKKDELFKELLQKLEIEEMNLEICSGSQIRQLLGEKWEEFSKQCIMLFMSHEDKPEGVALLTFFRKVCKKFYKKQNSSEILPPATLLGMVLGHSQFLPTMGQEETSSSQFRECLVDLLSTLVALDPAACCTGAHIPLFLAAYQASLSPTDQKILKLIFFYEQNQVDLQEFSPFVWGLGAIHHYARKRKNVNKVDINFGHIFLLLDPEKMSKTVVNFPLKLPFNPSETLEVDDGATLYDPRFMIALLTYLLDPAYDVHRKRFVECGCLGLLFAGLSSEVPEMREAAYTGLGRFHETIKEVQNAPMLAVWKHILESIANAGNMPRLPCITTQFLASLPTLFESPDDPLHRPIKTFLESRPNLELFRVPDFYTIFLGQDYQLRDMQLWMLDLIAQGLRTSLDLDICQKQHILEILATYYSSDLSSPATQAKILKCFKSAFKLPPFGRYLQDVTGLRSWITSLVCKGPERLQEEIKEAISLLNQTLLQKEEGAATKKDKK